MKPIGERIKEMRTDKGLTQGDLAKLVGISQGSIGHIEAGRNESSRHLAKIASALGVRAEWLESGSGDMKSAWPFDAVTPQEYAALSQADRDEIAAIVAMKVKRRRQGSSET